MFHLENASTKSNAFVSHHSIKNKTLPPSLSQVNGVHEYRYTFTLEKLAALPTLSKLAQSIKFLMELVTTQISLEIDSCFFKEADRINHMFVAFDGNFFPIRTNRSIG